MNSVSCMPSLIPWGIKPDNHCMLCQPLALHNQILLIGDSGVGKSCLLNRFTSDRFDESTTSTIGELSFLAEHIYIFTHARPGLYGSLLHVLP